MAGLPEVTVIGTLTADPELKFTPSGHAVANFTVAANDRRKDQTTGEWVDGDATFLRCAIWRDAAENVTNSLARGNRVIVTGRLKQRTYDNPEGQKRTAYELDVTEIGPSLKWATAKVAKPTRTGTAGRAGADPAGTDPWAAAPASPTGPASTDEPPF